MESICFIQNLPTWPDQWGTLWSLYEELLSINFGACFPEFPFSEICFLTSFFFNFCPRLHCIFISFIYITLRIPVLCLWANATEGDGCRWVSQNKSFHKTYSWKLIFGFEPNATFTHPHSIWLSCKFLNVMLVSPEFVSLNYFHCKNPFPSCPLGLHLQLMLF